MYQSPEKTRLSDETQQIVAGKKPVLKMNRMGEAEEAKGPMAEIKDQANDE